MATYVILSQLAPDAMKDPAELKKLAETVSQKIRAECPNVKWKESYAVMGRFDVVDIVEADSAAEVARAALLIRCYGHAQTETLHATPWKQFVGGL
jgi:uncharacterized protein with GYD domain